MLMLNVPSVARITMWGLAMTKIPNHKIEKEILALRPFENYNGTIVATLENGFYAIRHWETQILMYDTLNSEIIYLTPGVISQTTGRLVGRILRSLPRKAIENYLLASNLTGYERSRIVRMAGLEVHLP